MAPLHQHLELLIHRSTATFCASLPRGLLCGLPGGLPGGLPWRLGVLLDSHLSLLTLNEINLLPLHPINHFISQT